MRLLYVIERLSVKGGFERIQISKMNALAERGHEVMLLTLWQQGAPLPFPLDSRVQCHCLGLSEPRGCLRRVWTLLRATLLFNAFVRGYCPDVTLLSRAAGAWLAATTSWRGRMVFESHTVRSDSNHRWLYPCMERRVESVVCLTDGDAGEYRQHGRVRRVEVIPNFTDIVPLRDPDYSSRRVILVGRRCHEKDIERMERLWPVVQQDRPDWTLEIHSHTDNMPAAYADASIQVVTSRSESFSLALLEGHRCGLPCVAFDCRYGPRSIVEDGVSGFLAGYSEDNVFIERLCLLMGDVALRRRMGESARRRSELFDKEKVIDRWEDFLS